MQRVNHDRGKTLLSEKWVNEACSSLDQRGTYAGCKTGRLMSLGDIKGSYENVSNVLFRRNPLQI